MNDNDRNEDRINNTLDENKNLNNTIKTVELNVNTSNNDSCTFIEQNEASSIIDTILEEYGYGKEIWKIIITSFLLYLISGYFTTSLGSLLIAYKDVLNLSGEQISLLGSLFSFSKAFGCFITGELTLCTDRVRIIRSFLIILLFINLSVDLIMNYSFFCLFKVITGIISGVFEVIANNILCEYLPIRLRSLTLNSVWMGYNLAQILISLIMLFTMPNMEPSGISKTNLVFCVIILSSLLLSFVIVRESPRNLILNNREEEAFEILYKIKDKSYFTESLKDKLVNEIKKGNSMEVEFSKCNKFLQIFSKSYGLFTIIICIVSLGVITINDGGNILLSLTLKEINKENREEPSKDIIVNNILIYSFALISNVLFGVLSEMKNVGRKKSIFLGLVLLFLSLITIVMFPEHATLFMAIYNFFSNVVILVNSYASEVYPTKIRDTACGFNGMTSYLGSSVFQWILIYSHNLSWRKPYYIMNGIALVSAVLICFSPFETIGRPLDVEEIKKEKSNSGKDSYNYRRDDDSEKLISLDE